MQNFSVISQMLVSTFFAFALVCALAGAAIGVGLIVSREATLRFFSWINTWVPGRARMRWAEVPRDISRFVLAWRFWFAAAFLAGGVFILLTAAGQLSLARGPAQGSRVLFDLLLAVLLWLMITGSALIITIGIMLAVAPATLAALEAQSDRWISTRQAGRGLDEAGNRMHFGLDRLVADHPRAAGGILLLLSLAYLAAVGVAFMVR